MLDDPLLRGVSIVRGLFLLVIPAGASLLLDLSRNIVSNARGNLLLRQERTIIKLLDWKVILEASRLSLLSLCSLMEVHPLTLSLTSFPCSLCKSCLTWGLISDPFPS